MKRTEGEKIYAVFNYTFLTLLALITVYPFWQVLINSISSTAEVNRMAFKVWPAEISWAGYKEVMKNSFIWVGYRNTVWRIVLGTSVEMALMILTAYPLSKKYLPGRNVFTMFIVFTMFFSGGLIPGYLNIKSLGLDNTMWALVLPLGINTFNMLILRNFFMGIPDEIEESAKIDGASTMQVLLYIVLPLSVPILMTVGLWSIVGHWNAWFDCLIYIRDSDKYVLQAILRKIIIDAAPQFDTIDASARNIVKVDVEVTKSATIVVSTLPIMVVYPFIQKYFVKGIMVGSLKG